MLRNSLTTHGAQCHARCSAVALASADGTVPARRLNVNVNSGLSRFGFAEEMSEIQRENGSL